MPEFSKCSLKTLPFWIPSFFLWIFAPVEVYFLLKKRFASNNRYYSGNRQPITIPYNFYNVSRLFCVILLIIANVAQLFHDLCYYNPFLDLINKQIEIDTDVKLATSADISASLLNIITFVSIHHD